MDDVARLRLERDLFRRLLELGTREDLAPFLEEALALVVEVTGARQGYLALGPPDAPSFWRAHGLNDAELADARREISSGIIAEALCTGRTVSTASALEDPRFLGQESVRAQRIRAVLCAPVGAPHATGVVYLQGRDAPGPFPDGDREHTELFARHLAPLAERLLAREREADLRDHTAELRARLAVGAVAGTSAALADVFRQIGVAAPVSVPVLFTGESGTGKTALALALHESSPRARGPFVELNCAAIPESLFESELFGAEKGAHSTATHRLEGKIDAARGGTLFLDEVGEIPLGAQPKLLTFLQSRRYFRLGSNLQLEADVRILAATNADLEERVRDRRFREDLFYRLNVLEVRVPPLRARREDIAPIADALARSIGEANGRFLPLARAARAALLEEEWPGNVRQLENALQRGWAVAASEQASLIEMRHLYPARAGETEPRNYQEAMRAFQARLLRETLEACGWNVSEAARRLDVSRSHLNDLLRAHGISRP